jgi:hypothetical protein
MIGFIWRVIIGRFASCSHRWETIDQKRIDYIDTGTTGIIYIMRCKDCGEVKQKTIK